MTTYSQLSDEALYQQVKNDGDVNAFEVLYRRHFKVLYSFARKHMRDEDLIADVLQDVFTKIWERREAIEIHKNVFGYLCSVTYNTAMERIRRENFITEFIAVSDKRDKGENNAENQLLLRDLQHSVDRSLEHMPKQVRTVFVSSRFRQLSHLEISEQLGISVSTVKAHINDALKIVRKHVRPILLLAAAILLS